MVFVPPFALQWSQGTARYLMPHRPPTTNSSTFLLPGTR